MKIGMILLAAGKAARFGQSKLETSLSGHPVIEYILQNIPFEHLQNIVIVAANENILNTAQQYGISGIINEKPDEGIARSIRLGTKLSEGMDAYMYCVADQPLLKKATIADMIKAYQQNTILALSAGKRRGNPVIFPAFLHNELVSLKKDQSGQKIINAHLDILKLYDISDESQLVDIDTKADFDAICKIIEKSSL